MTQHYFVRAAAMVKAIRDGEWTHDLPTWQSEQVKRIEVFTDTLGNVDVSYVRAVWTAEAFILLFREHNSRFDPHRFLAACGLV